MGYRREPATIKLTFEDETLDGFECRVRSVSIEEYLVVFDLAAGPISWNNPEKLHSMLGKLIETVVDWNLEDDDGTAIEPTVESLLKQDRAFVGMLWNAWLEAMVTVPGPLSERSKTGPEPTVSTEELSVLASLAQTSQALPESQAS